MRSCAERSRRQGVGARVLGVCVGLTGLALCWIPQGIGLAAAASEIDAEPDLVRWQTQTLFEVVAGLLGEGEYELASAVLSSGTRRLGVADRVQADVACPGSPSATGVFLVSAKRSIVLAQALLESGDVAGATRLIRASVLPVERYARFVDGRRQADAEQLLGELRRALAIASKTPDASAGVPRAGEPGVDVAPERPGARTPPLSPSLVWGWFARLETWCHRSELDALRADPGPEQAQVGIGETPESRQAAGKRSDPPESD